MNFLNENIKEAAGYKYVLDSMEIFSPYGEKIKKSIKPFKNVSSLNAELDSIGNILKMLEKDKDIFDSIEKEFYLCGCDITESVLNVKHGKVLDEVELFELKKFAASSERIRNLYEKLQINIYHVNFYDISDVFELLDDGRKIETFQMYDRYSEKLEKIRKRKRKIEEAIYNEEDKNRQETLKKERLSIVCKEENEEINVKKYLSEVLMKNADAVLNNIYSFGRLDFLLAKARMAVKNNLSKPEISEDIKLEMENGINPRVDSILNKKGKRFVPVSIKVCKGAAVITGANMGGKSVTLSTIGLNLCLAQTGFYVFCSKFVFSMMDFFYYISDDMQSVSKGLSTFGAEIIQLNEIIDGAKKKRGLIILDEFARGTNPEEGSILVNAVINYLSKLDSISIITTHYDGVCPDSVLHYEVRGLKNAEFEKLKSDILKGNKNSIDLIQENMDYRLDLVSSDSETPKDAINICRLLGLDETIIKYCEKKIMLRNIEGR